MDFFNLNKNILNKNILKKINLLILSDDNDAKNLIRKKINFNETINVLFANKKNKKHIKQPFFANTIFYPISPYNFLILANSIICSQSLEKFGLSIENNTLKGQQNKKSSLTNTEVQILYALVLNKEVERKELEKDVLNFKNEITSNSLDSHLVRLRKKIKHVNSKIEITSTKSKHINIILIS